MNQTPADFSKQLIKGKIAEHVFEQMFRRAGQFTVLPFGYESTMPELAQQQHSANPEARRIISDLISTTPDFVLVSKRPSEKDVYLVEVKYRSNLRGDDISEVARKVHEKWHVVWLFVATPEGFYFDSCKNVIDTGKMKKLAESFVNEQTQDEFLRLLNEFELKSV